jgi:hypothetical protein
MKTYRYIRDLSESTLYSEAGFSCCSHLQVERFKDFLIGLTTRQRALMRAYYCFSTTHWIEKEAIPSLIESILAQDFPDMKEISACT